MCSKLVTQLHIQNQSYNNKQQRSLLFLRITYTMAYSTLLRSNTKRRNRRRKNISTYLAQKPAVQNLNSLTAQQKRCDPVRHPEGIRANTSGRQIQL